MKNCSEESCGKNTANAKLKVVKLLEVLERSDSISIIGGIFTTDL